MQTTHAKEAAEAATNINREDWISGAAELVLNNQVQYDRSTRKGKEAFISLDNVMEDVMGMHSVKLLLMKWMQGEECCDSRDELVRLVNVMITHHLSMMADDFNVGVE